jgi:hypothetical protein
LADLEQESPADEREAYKGTPSEETAIANKKTMKRGENRRFSTLKANGRKRQNNGSGFCFPSHFFFVCGGA